MSSILNFEEQIGKEFLFQANYITNSGDAVLLRHIVAVHHDQLFRDHVWLPTSKKFEQLKLTENEQIIFRATVNWYSKGHEPEKIYGTYLYKHDQQLVKDLTLKNIKNPMRVPEYWKKHMEDFDFWLLLFPTVMI